MKRTSKLIDALPAKHVLEAILDLKHFYFPEALREKFEATAKIFEEQNQDYWIERFNSKKADLAIALNQLGGWLHEKRPDLLMMGWHDEVFFFYVLRTQFVFANIASHPESMVPGRLDDFWRHAMTPKKDEMCMFYVVVTLDAFKAAPVKPPMWRVPIPRDFPESALPKSKPETIHQNALPPGSECTKDCPTGEPVTWLHVLNLLWQAAAAVQPRDGWSRDYGWQWVETASAQTRNTASAEVLSYALSLSWSGGLHESVRAMLYLRALCAMEWALTFREKKEAPSRDEVHDFVAWSMNTMWDEEGLAWTKRRLLPIGPMPPLPSPGPKDPSQN